MIDGINSRYPSASDYERAEQFMRRLFKDDAASTVDDIRATPFMAIFMISDICSIISK